MAHDHLIMTIDHAQMHILYFIHSSQTVGYSDSSQVVDAEAKVHVDAVLVKWKPNRIVRVPQVVHELEGGLAGPVGRASAACHAAGTSVHHGRGVGVGAGAERDQRRVERADAASGRPAGARRRTRSPPRRAGARGSRTCPGGCVPERPALVCRARCKLSRTIKK